jgi:hypothetical protein
MKTGLREQVIQRDAEYLWKRYLTFEKWPGSYYSWIRSQRVICIVPALDPHNPYLCGGSQEVDHVKDEPMMGKKAPDDEYHLVAMCQNHNTWHPPRKELRQAEREYLGRISEAASSRTTV